jgi:predicted PurR-regulated permease PerM
VLGSFVGHNSGDVYVAVVVAVIVVVVEDDVVYPIIIYPRRA